MGTTAEAIRSQSGVSLGYVLCIEGYKYLLTSGTPTDATTAWSGTLWSDALPGLMINGSFSQSCEPFQNELQVPRISFAVMPTIGNDQFGQDMFKAKSSVRSELTVGFDSGDSSGGSFNITVQDADQFSTGTVYVGRTAYNVTSAPSGTTISVAANGEGYYAPFSGTVGSSNRYPSTHNVRTEQMVGNATVHKPVYVSDVPSTWIGKKVGLWVHRIVNGVWDTKAEAELWFAGIIEDVAEDSSGATVLHCADMRRLIDDAVILNDQFSFKMQPGFNFSEGDWIALQVFYGTSFNNCTDRLTCVSGASGTDEFEPGRYTADELAPIIANYANNDATIGRSVSLYWSVGRFQSGGGERFRIAVKRTSTTNSHVAVSASRPSILEYLGFETTRVLSNYFVFEPPDERTDEPAAVGIDPPMLVAPVRPLNKDIVVAGEEQKNSIAIDSYDGKIVNYTDYLPEEAKYRVSAGEVWSFFQYGKDAIFFGKLDSATSPTTISNIVVLNGFNLTPIGTVSNKPGYYLAGSTESVTVKQVVVYTDTFANVLTRLLSSIDGNAANDATYDTFTGGGAGIPYDLLGSNWVNSCKAVQDSTMQDSLTVVVEKPTQLWDVIKSELLLRMCSIVWKDGGYQLAQLTTPNATTADHTLTEANKSDTRRTSTSVTRQWQTHTIKIEHNRDPITDKYPDKLIVRDVGSYQELGSGGKTITIKARNQYSSSVSSGSSIEDISALIAARFLPVLSKPIKVWERSISHNHFHIAPGDTISLSDDWVRDPATGQRGVSNRACTVLDVSHSFGIDSGSQGYFGSVRLIFTEEDRTYPLAPSAEHATITSGSYSSGWDSGNKKLLLHQGKFKVSSETTTDAGHFSNGDAVRITELSPANPASADSFTDVLASAPEIAAVTAASIDYDSIELTTGFGGGNPVFDSAKTYIVTLDDYSTVSATQKLHAFQADAADGFIQDTTDPNLYADSVSLLGESADLTLLPDRHAAEMYGDGEPLSSNTVRHLCRMANNLNNFKTAPNGAMLDGYFGAVVGSTGSTSVYRAVWVFPFFVGKGSFPGTKQRKLRVRLMAEDAAGVSTAYARVWSSDAPPTRNITDTAGGLSAVFTGAKQGVSWAFTNTTPGYSSAKDLPLVRGLNDPEITWITVEINDHCQLYGIAELWLQELA